MPQTRSSVTVDPSKIGTASVRVTTPSGTDVPAYTTANGDTAVTWPDEITTSTTFHLTTDGDYLVSVKVNGVEVANGSSGTVRGGSGHLTIAPSLNTIVELAAGLVPQISDNTTLAAGLAAQDAFTGTFVAHVVYAGDVGAARPTADVVMWLNFPSEPTNIAAGDLWLDLDAEQAPAFLPLSAHAAKVSISAGAGAASLPNNSITVIPFDNADQDTYSLSDGTGIVADKTGWWMVTTAMQSSSFTNTNKTALIQVAGTTVAQASQPQAGARWNASALVRATLNDTIRIAAYQTSGSPQTIATGANNSFMSAVWLGE